MSKTPDDWLEENEDRLGDALDIPGPSPNFRARLLDATARQVRFRRQRRTFMQAAAIILAFLSGMAVMSGLQPNASQLEQVTKQPSPIPDTDQAKVPMPDDTTPVSTGDDAPEAEFSHSLLADPEAFTLRYQQADTDERLRLLRAAGDHYFFQEGNIDLAAKFYREFLASIESGSSFFNIDSSNWLFASIAESAKEISSHETEI